MNALTNEQLNIKLALFTLCNSQEIIREYIPVINPELLKSIKQQKKVTSSGSLMPVANRK
jgi:hypothetical protein